MRLHRLIINTKTFQGINGPYLSVHTLLRFRKLSLCLHQFHRGDEDPAPHDHPFAFFSLVLAGGYKEYLDNGRFVIRKPLSLAYRPATHRHRVELLHPSRCWTLCLKYAANRQWGFWEQGKFIPWQDYLRGKGLEGPFID